MLEYDPKWIERFEYLDIEKFGTKGYMSGDYQIKPFKGMENKKYYDIVLDYFNNPDFILEDFIYLLIRTPDLFIATEIVIANKKETIIRNYLKKCNKYIIENPDYDISLLIAEKAYCFKHYNAIMSLTENDIKNINYNNVFNEDNNKIEIDFTNMLQTIKSSLFCSLNLECYVLMCCLYEIVLKRDHNPFNEKIETKPVIESKPDYNI